MLTFIFGVLPYLVLAAFVWGWWQKSAGYLRTPVPYKIYLSPAPPGRAAAAVRPLLDLLAFRHLTWADKLARIPSLAFHVCLALVLLRHLRYFLYPTPDWVMAFNWPGVAAGYLLPVLLLWLLLRRLCITSLISFSAPADFFILALLLALSLSGLALRLFFRVDLIEIKTATLGLIRFSPYIPQNPGFFIVHFLLTLVFLAYYPFSKLIHFPALLFSSARNQADDLARKRHINPWDGPEIMDTGPSPGAKPGPQKYESGRSDA
ncbi:MAG: respiratory nitrate reductase subunit gamma [Pseudomonadota bacterium]